MRERMHKCPKKFVFFHYCVWIGNCLCELPFSLGSLSSLRTFNVSDNNIVQLPKQLAYIRTLEVCVLKLYLIAIMGHTNYISLNKSFICYHRSLHLMLPWWPIHLHLCVLRVQRVSSDSSVLVRLHSSSQVMYGFHSDIVCTHQKVWLLGCT